MNYNSYLYLIEYSYESGCDYSFSFYNPKQELTFSFGYNKGVKPNYETVLFMWLPKYFSDEKIKIIFEYDLRYSHSDRKPYTKVEALFEYDHKSIIIEQKIYRRSVSPSILCRELAKTISKGLLFCDINKIPIEKYLFT